MLPVRERLDRRGVHAHADLELAERERVVAQAVHQHFLEPVPQGLLLLERAAELELRLAAGADQLGHAARCRSRRRRCAACTSKNVSARFNCCGGGVRAQPEAARPEQHVDGDPDRVGERRARTRARRARSTPTRSCPSATMAIHRVVAGLGELQALGVRPADHEERRARREVVLERRVAGVDLAPVAAGLVAGLVEREEVAARRPDRCPGTVRRP